MEHAHHSHPVDVHLLLCILKGGKLQWAAYPHAGVVDEDIQPAFGLNDLLHDILTIGRKRNIRPQINDAGEPFRHPAKSTIDLVSVGGEPLRHRPAETGRDARDEDNHTMQ